MKPFLLVISGLFLCASCAKSETYFKSSSVEEEVVLPSVAEKDSSCQSGGIFNKNFPNLVDLPFGKLGLPEHHPLNKMRSPEHDLNKNGLLVGMRACVSANPER